MKGDCHVLFQGRQLTQHCHQEIEKSQETSIVTVPNPWQGNIWATSHVSVASLLLTYQISRCVCIGACTRACQRVRNINCNFLYTFNYKIQNLNLKITFCEALTFFTPMRSTTFRCHYEAKNNSICGDHVRPSLYLCPNISDYNFVGFSYSMC